MPAFFRARIGTSRRKRCLAATFPMTDPIQRRQKTMLPNPVPFVPRLRRGTKRVPCAPARLREETAFAYFCRVATDRVVAHPPVRTVAKRYCA